MQPVPKSRVGASTTVLMKKLFFILSVLLVAYLYIGFYEKIEDAYPEKVFFIKRYPSFQMEFENIFAYESDDKTLSELSDLERQKVIAYCKYRLGLATTLTTQSELDSCKAR